MRLSGSSGTFPELSNPVSPAAEPEGFLFDSLGPVLSIHPFAGNVLIRPGARIVFNPQRLDWSGVLRVETTRAPSRQFEFQTRTLPVRACVGLAVGFNPTGLNRFANISLLAVVVFLAGGCATVAPKMNSTFQNYMLDYNTPVDAALQTQLENIDSTLRAEYGMTTEQTDVGVLDLRTLRLAMIRPDHEMYGASVPKIGIFLAYFQLHPAAATNLDAVTRHELGLMIKVSSNEMAAKFSQELGLKQIRQVLDLYHFYDANHGGGIWVGKHYGVDTERVGSPVGDNSHAATVRQLLRFYLLLEQGKLVSPAASKTMLEIFASPDIPHDDNKFVKALSGRDVQILRKSGSWENWLHDTAIITGPGRHYILVALTQHPKGDEYLVDLAVAADDLMIRDAQTGQ